MNKNKYSIIILATFLVFPVFCYAAQVDSTDIAHMRIRISELESANPPSQDRVQSLINSMQPDGSWSAVNYEDLEVSHWLPYHHLTDYLLPLAKAYAKTDSPFYHDQDLVESMHKALDYWLNHNFTSRNWWYNDIGVPRTLSDILIMMGHEVTLGELLKAFNQMRGSYITQTGQNKVWRAEIQLKIGLLEYGQGRSNLLGSPAGRIEKASKVLQDEVVIWGKEGIQPDWSFHQHGVQQQFGNYGLAFASSQATWAYILKGTPFAYPSQKIEKLRNYVVKGLSKVVWNGEMDVSGIGRQVFPESRASKGGTVIRVLRLMSKSDPGHATEYQDLARSLSNVEKHPSKLQGNTYFWRSDLMVNRSDASYMSVRMCSKKIQSTESGNGENIKGAHLSDGATYIYQSGREYQDIFPVWDWHRIPGVTSYSSGPLPDLSWRGLHNGSDYVGGVSDTTFGIAAMLFKRNGLTAHKAWFMGPDRMICLGSGIQSNRENQPVFTTINQSQLDGQVYVKSISGSNSLKTGEKHENTDIQGVFHHRTGYVFLQPENVHVDAVQQTGSWRNVYTDGTQKSISRDVFNLWIDHGSGPKLASYAYMIKPGIDQERFSELLKSPTVHILSNTTEVQAIQDEDAGLTQIVFYKEGNLRIDGNNEITVNTPCMIMVQRVTQGLKMTVAVPPELPNDVSITMMGHYEGKHCNYDNKKKETTIAFTLPDGIQAGKSVSRILMKD